jgi:hypothetical protein
MPATVSGRVFVSYRRQDSSGSAGRIYDRLAERFGDDQVFMDVDAIKPGEDFRKVITQKVSTCQVLLAIIGPRWLDQEQWGQRRLEAPDDILRLEIAAALERGIRVIPILVEGAVMPKREELPDDLASLAGRNASTLRHESFHSDADRLLAVIEGILAADVAQRTDPASVDDVNLRATLGPGQVDEGLAVFSLYKREAVRRHIWFCECLEGHGGPVTLPLLARGIILQVRQDAGHAGVATLKLRGPDASIDPELWHRRTQALDDDARIEGDWTADRHLLSVSLNARIQDGLIEEVAAQRPQRVQRLFSPSQEALVADWLVPIDRLKLLGPVRALKWKAGTGGLEREVAAELWEVHSGPRFLELSIRVGRGQNPILAQRRLEAALLTRGLRIDLEQTKTRTVLEYFAAASGSQ